MISVIQLLQSALMLLVLQGRRVEQAYGSMFHSPSITPLDCNMNFILLFAQAAQRDCRKTNFGKYISRPAVGGGTRFSSEGGLTDVSLRQGSVERPKRVDLAEI